MNFSRFAFCVSLLVSTAGGGAQEIGSNFNHIPENINFEYLEKTEVDWVRVTPYILDYFDGKRSLKGEYGLDNVIEAGERGYKVAFGFRWDFKKRGMRIPKPGTELESALFALVRENLEMLGPHVDIFKLGNEPSFETLAEDLEYDEEGKVPLVVFMQRLLTEVVEPHYASNPEWKRPDIYVGSLVWLYAKKQQDLPATREMIRFARESEAIKGVALHVHVRQPGHIEESFEFLRSLLPEKPIIVPEFSLQRLNRDHLPEKLGVNKAGRAFAKKYRRDPSWALYEWFNYANQNETSVTEWRELMASRSWYPESYLLRYYEAFETYGVVLSTYPLRFTRPARLKPDSATWFINPIFLAVPLVDEKGNPTEENPLCHEDFDTIVARGKAR